MRIHTGRSSPGLTFIEVQISLLLLLIGILAIIEISPLFMQGSRLAELHALAQGYAENFMEQEMGRPYIVLSSLVASEPDTGYDPITTAQIPQVRANTYEYRIRRSYHPTLGNDVIVVTVEVRWRDPNARRYNRFTPDRAITLVSYKALYP
jgi:Tfp pilus assembly protein PilV